jgi:hypothetical protein
MSDPILVAKRDAAEFFLLPQMANRHGVITGATGTGKTVTLQRLAESFSQRGVPVFMADIKGDLTGISQPGSMTGKVGERLTALGFTDVKFEGSPVTLWDVFGKQGHPLRATVSEMGPLLISRILQLNETQKGVLTIAFKVADENGLLLLDLKDLQSQLQFIGENADELTLKYGNVLKGYHRSYPARTLCSWNSRERRSSSASRQVKLDDFIQTLSGKGVLNILAATDLINSPKLYSTFLLWLLSELFEMLPEAGDLDKPKLVFFFDEAHLLFNDAPQSLVEKIEQVVRLIRSKGVGVYFVTQSPADIPDKVLAQLGNRVQHALRAYTPKEQEAVSVAAKSFRENPALDTVKTITELGVGEVSDLDSRCEGRSDCRRSRVRRAARQPDRTRHARCACATDEHFARRGTVRTSAGPRVRVRDLVETRRGTCGGCCRGEGCRRCGEGSGETSEGRACRCTRAGYTYRIDNKECGPLGEQQHRTFDRNADRPRRAWKYLRREIEIEK